MTAGHLAFVLFATVLAMPAPLESGHPGRAEPAVAVPASVASPRIRYTINEGWRYVSGEPAGAESVQHADSAWSGVNLPHTWNAEDAFTKALGYRRGVGWYRKHLALDSSLTGKRLFLFFEGANQVAEVFVNGHSAGRHIGGYTAFAFDITDLVRLDCPNVIAVRVDNRHDDDIPPLNADFTFYGGIYRDVWLVATSPVHITLLDHGSPGVFIDTPEISREYATVRVRGTVMNHEPRAKRVEVVNRVLNAAGAEVAVMRSRLQVPAASSASFEQQSTRVMRPLLWSPEEPNLYRVVTEIHDGAVLADRTSNPLGFRWFSVDAQRGFSLNGHRYPLYGTNRHQDRAVFGNALENGAHREDVTLVKATGFNFLRLAHYPQDPVVLDEMDRQGLVGWEEIPVVNIISLSSAFAENSERMLVEMIRQHYNHPSILFWGYMNEVLLRKPVPMPDRYFARVLALTKRLEARVKAEDATRATVTAISFDEVDDGSGVQDVPDVLGLNLYFGWYYRTLEGLGPYLDSLHAKHPTRPLLVSEYGADSDERIHTLAPVAFDFSTEHQQRFHESNFSQMRTRDYLVGTAVWNQFDFGSKGRHDSKPNINQKGLLYLDRKPKDVWYYYRAVMRRDTVLHIASRDWLVRAGSSTADAQQPVVVYTNLPRVELFANGVSLGTKQTVNATATWSVPFRAGKNRLEVRGGNGVVDAVDISYEDRSGLFGPRRSSAGIIAVNAGSHYQYVDASGMVWEADHPYRQGGWGYVGGETRLRHHRIYGTNEDALYQVERIGAELYRFDVRDGDYDVRLLFVEQEYDQPGQRVFDVEVNGQQVFRGLDLAASHGRYNAVERTIVANAAAGEGITVRLKAVTGRTTIGGIMLRAH
jgi:beta-galactosidase